MKWTKRKMMIKLLTNLKRLKHKVDLSLVWQEGEGGELKMYLKEYFSFEKFKTLKKGGSGSRLAGGSSPTPSQSSEKTLTEAEIAVSRILTSAFDSMLLLPMIAYDCLDK